MRLLVVSNRLPVVLEARADGCELRPGSGGLVTAVSAILRRHRGVWIGWPGNVREEQPGLQSALRQFELDNGYKAAPVFISAEEEEGFYRGFSNEIIWPLFHDLLSRCNFVPEYWQTYAAVKQKFADAILREASPQDFIWVHDYHLMGLGRRLRERGVRSAIGFFLHTPFPPPDIFCKLPWRDDTIRSLLQYDLAGFQTLRDRENFLDNVRRLLPGARLRRARGGVEVAFADRVTRVGHFPIGIDYAEFADGAAQPTITERARQVRRDMGVEQVIISVDRLDYTKGIPFRLKAFQLALRRYPELHGRIAQLQVVVPSRETVAEYQLMKAEIEQIVSQVNGEFTQPGWAPIHHVFRSLNREELLAYYRAADVALATPLKDGMNLVAKEYCACQVEGNGVLILSEFAGAAVQFARDAMLVNPCDIDAVAEAIRRAAFLTPAERRPPMRRLRSIVRRQDVFWWLDRYLAACGLNSDAIDAAPGPVQDSIRIEQPTARAI